MFLHMNGPDKVWPKTFECQGAHGHQGEVFCLGTKAMNVPEKGGFKSMDAAAEKPLGEWNTYEAICKGDTITVLLNGKVVNRLTGCVPSNGRIGFQSENGAWEARRVTIKPLSIKNSSLLEIPPLKVLIIDGQNGHDWKATTPVLKWILEDCGRFTVDVSTTPSSGPNAPSLPKNATAEQQAAHEVAMAKWKIEKDEFKVSNINPWKQWRPRFANYDVIVMNYAGDRWPDEVRGSFTKYVQNGGGLVIYHAANNSFPEWPEYNEMMGVGGWGGRNEKSGPMIRWRDGKIIRDEMPGPGGTHGPAHEYVVEIRDFEHPITKGLPERWMHSFDELYSKLRGPAKNLTVLATAYADPAKQGSGENEPMLMTINYGQGRVFHNALGHMPKSMEDVGFIVTMQRGTEWAATGRVTLPLPKPEDMSAEKIIRRLPKQK
jgi:type 1 glutamine amidotransferase